MRKLMLLALLAALTPALPAADDVVFKAMRDELARSMKKLQLETLNKAYFIAYRMVDTDTTLALAAFGALTEGSTNRTRFLTVEVRVGDYALDNTNFFAMRTGMSGVVRFNVETGLPIPLDDNYDELRRQLWLATDSAYKQALDDYSKKRGALENRTRTDAAPDFSHEPAVSDTENADPIRMNLADAEVLVKSLSSLFRETPAIDDSSARLEVKNVLTRYVNSEGTTFTRAEPRASLVVSAETQAADGMPLADAEEIYVRSLAGLHSRDQLIARIRDLQKRLVALRSAPLVERYTGPVLFEGESASALMAQGLAPALMGVPRLVVDDMRFEKIFASDDGSLMERMGGRILPDWVSVVDNPAAKEFQGQALLGGYQVDEDGVKARPTTLVDKGVLKTLLHTRALIAGTTESTASRRGFGPAPSNLLLTADKSMPPGELKAELMRIAKQRGKEYGILVRRVGNPNPQTSGRARTIIVTSHGAATVEVGPLTAAYKVYLDGREELVRNLSILGMTIASFKDIVAVSNDTTASSYVFRTRRISPALTGGLLAVQPLMTVAAPSLLFDELTLQRPTGEIPNLPFTKHPFFDK